MQQKAVTTFTSIQERPVDRKPVNVQLQTGTDAVLLPGNETPLHTPFYTLVYASSFNSLQTISNILTKHILFYNILAMITMHESIESVLS